MVGVFLWAVGGKCICRKSWVWLFFSDFAFCYFFSGATWDVGKAVHVLGTGLYRLIPLIIKVNMFFQHFESNLAQSLDYEGILHKKGEFPRSINICKRHLFLRKCLILLIYFYSINFDGNFWPIFPTQISNFFDFLIFNFLPYWLILNTQESKTKQWEFFLPPSINESKSGWNGEIFGKKMCFFWSWKIGFFDKKKLFLNKFFLSKNPIFHDQKNDIFFPKISPFQRLFLEGGKKNSPMFVNYFNFINISTRVFFFQILAEISTIQKYLTISFLFRVS